MKDWKAASQFIRRRSSSLIYENLAVSAPFTFSPSETQSETSEFINSNWEDISSEYNSILSLPARDVNFVNDALIAVCKFWHVVGCARSNAGRGALTWTIVDAYHACLLGARALLSLHGVLTYSMRGRTVLIDFRPESGSVDEVRAFAKANRNVANPIRVLLPVSRQLEQKDTWNLLVRLCNVIPANEPNVATMKGILNFASKPLSQTRNTIIYDSVFWVWRGDFEQRAAQMSFAAGLNEVDEVVRDTVQALQSIFSISQHLTGDLCKNVGIERTALSDVANLGEENLWTFDPVDGAPA